MNRPLSRVSMNRPLSRVVDLIGRKVTKSFRGHKGLFHGTVVAVAEVKSTLKFPVIYSVFFEEHQSEVRMNSRDVLKLLDVTDEFQGARSRGGGMLYVWVPAAQSRLRKASPCGITS
jgi:hypothetical protein